jgi:mRNA interferase MazF
MKSLDRGDLVWLTVYDAQGHELKGRHPAVVISPSAYNHATRMAVVCSITSVAKNNLFEVSIPEGLKISGVIKIDSIHTIDWGIRKFDVADHLPSSALDVVLDRVRAFLA